MSLKSLISYNDKSRTQSSPALCGAHLTVRQATADDLPPGCVWINAATVETAAQEVQRLIIEGEAVSGVWVPPDRGLYRMARHFFRSAHRHLDADSWGEELEVDDPRMWKKKFKSLDQAGDSYLLEGRFNTARHYQSALYKAAHKETGRWLQAFGQAIQARNMSPFVEADKRYFAHPLSYYIHADGDGANPGYRGLRILIGWAGDPPFLYDYNQLKLMPAVTKKREFYVYRPRHENVDAWQPPQRSVVFITQGDWQRAVRAVHSAKGFDYTVEKRLRVQGKIDITMPT